MKKLITTCMTALVTACGGFTASAQGAYPVKPVTLVATYAPGGSADIVSRIIARAMSKELGQSVIVENRAGAGGNIGATHVARAQNDGYTLLLGGAATHGTNPSLYNMPFDPIKDFEPISLVAQLTPVLLVYPGLPFKTLDDLVKYAKANPGKLTYASGGVGTTAHLAAEWFKSQQKLDIVHIPYKGGGAAMIDQLAGRVDMQFDLLTAQLQNIKNGSLRALALPTAKRSPLAPEIPTFAEAGYPGVQYTSWFAMYAPAGTPAPIVEKLNAVLVKVLSSAEVKQQLLTNGTDATPSSIEDLRLFTASEIHKWREIITAARITTQ